MIKDNNLNSLIIPIYINEKIIIDMLAIIDDGFSKVSQINSLEKIDDCEKNSMGIGISTSNIINNFLKIDFRGDIDNKKTNSVSKNTSLEKVHTTTSLLSKFRSFILRNNLLKIDCHVNQVKIGDFIELEGKLQKNPLIEFIDAFIDIFKIVEIFSEGNNSDNSKGRKQVKDNQKIVKQIKSFSDELKHSGTIDFIMSNGQANIVLSAQEKYLSNDNISEMLGGTFKVLGKIVAICEDDSKDINLLRKTTLSLLSEDMLQQLFSGFSSRDLAQFNLPEFKTKIKGPAMIIIPIAIYS